MSYNEEKSILGKCTNLPKFKYKVDEAKNRMMYESGEMQIQLLDPNNTTDTKFDGYATMHTSEVINYNNNVIVFITEDNPDAYLCYTLKEIYTVLSENYVNLNLYDGFLNEYIGDQNSKMAWAKHINANGRIIYSDMTTIEKLVAESNENYLYVCDIVTGFLTYMYDIKNLLFTQKHNTFLLRNKRNVAIGLNVFSTEMKELYELEPITRESLVTHDYDNKNFTNNDYITFEYKREWTETEQENIYLISIITSKKTKKISSESSGSSKSSKSSESSESSKSTDSSKSSESKKKTIKSIKDREKKKVKFENDINDDDKKRNNKVNKVVKNENKKKVELSDSESSDTSTTENTANSKKSNEKIAIKHKTINKTLVIDCEEKVDKCEDYNNYMIDFSREFGSDIINLTNIKIDNLKIKIYPVINSTCNTFTVGGYECTLGDGSYTINEIIEELNDNFDSVDCGVEIILKSNGKLLLENRNGEDFEIDCRNNSVGKYLGFTKDKYTGKSKYTAEKIHKFDNLPIYLYFKNLSDEPIATINTDGTYKQHKSEFIVSRLPCLIIQFKKEITNETNDDVLADLTHDSHIMTLVFTCCDN